jgi:tetratricopeptide (TPR) repeat protein
MNRSILSISLLLFTTASSFCQIMPLTLEPDGGNKKASISEQIGIVKIAIEYSRPGVKGREGKIWNTPVAHYGFADQGHGTSYAAPWRAGANENTTMSFSHPVRIEGKDLPAGKYGFFIALGENESTLIFSKVNNSWGSFYYDSTQDALRVNVKNENLDKSMEWLRYEFTDETPNSAIITMSWEKRRISFKVDADVQALQIASFKSELRTTRPFYDFISAANYCLRNNIELEQALAWMDRAIYFRIMGVKNFQTLSTKAAVLMKLNRMDEARKIMDEAIPYGTVLEVHFYARTLLNQKQSQEAVKVFKMNYDKFPNVFTTNVGLARAYSATGDYKKALQYMKAALPLAPDEGNKTSVTSMIQKLEAGKDVNQ